MARPPRISSVDILVYVIQRGNNRQKGKSEKKRKFYFYSALIYAHYTFKPN